MSKRRDTVYPLCQHLDSLVDTLRKLVPQALEKFDVDGIHKARVATRRIKAALDLLESVLNQEHSDPFAKVGRKLRRRLGPLRDIDVMLDHLDEIEPEHKLAPAASWLRQRLQEERAVARAGSKDQADSSRVLSRLGTWWALRQDVIDSDSKLAELLKTSLQTQLDQFVEHAEHIRSVQGEQHDPHALRIAGKKLRYTLELAAAQGRKLPSIVLRTFKRMQGFLGLWHDFVVMAVRAMRSSLDAELALHDPPMQRQVLALAEFALKRAEREMGHFTRLWSEKGPLITREIQEKFGLVSEPKTGPDPAGSPPIAAAAAPLPTVPPAA